MIDEAERDIRNLRSAKSCANAREAWISFLEHANRAINRLEGYSKRTNQTPKFKHLLTNEIWATDLTRYMRTARNAHEHGVQDLEVDDPFNHRIVYSNGQVSKAPILIGTTADGETVVFPATGPAEITISGEGARAINMGPSIMMIPIVNPKGETIMPPWGVEIEAEDEPDALAAARLYLKWVVEQISGFD